MAATVDSLITASTYNSIRAKVNKVLGAGDGAEFGYGQTLSSSIMSDNDLITAQDMQNLYDDIELAAKHQTGDPVVWTTSDGLNAPSAGEIVGVYAAELGPLVPGAEKRTTLNSVVDTDEGYLDFEQAAAQIETGHFQIGPGALTTTIAETSVRTSPWNTSIDHIVTVLWDSAEHRRTWANAGGKIRFNANLTGGTSQPGDETNTPPGTKDEIWQTMLNTMGTIEIGVQGTTTTGTGTANTDASIIYAERSELIKWNGDGSLTFGGSNAYTPSNRLTIFTKNGSGVYSENSYIIQGAEVDGNALRFYISFNDTDVGDSQDPDNLLGESTPIDENITGTITSTISFVNPNGFLDVNPPSIVRSSAL